MTVTDAQLHVWEADRPDRPWDRNHAPQLPEPFTVERAIELLDANGVDRAVLVPPLVSGFNSDTANAYALEAAAAYSNRLVVMGRFDPRPPDARRRLETWLDQPGMRGVRLSLEGPPAPQLLEEGHLTGSGRRPSGSACRSTSCARAAPRISPRSPSATPSCA